MADFSRLADFFFECGMLRQTPRSGYSFLGSGKENVAEHTCRTAMIAYALAAVARADVAKVVEMSLFHDLHEARTGDFNYVNHFYDSCKARNALEDCTKDTGLEERILNCWDEFEQNASMEANLAHDADQLDLICNLRQQQKLGNPDACRWIRSAIERLRTKIGQDAADAIIARDPSAWWYDQFSEDWWAHRK